MSELRSIPQPPGTRYLPEPSRNLPIAITADVVVAGGGIAGVAAALAAGRHGVRVVLLERAFGLGGLATLGHVVKYLPLCDGYGKQVMGGLAEELLRHSVIELKAPYPPAGFIPIPECWKQGGDPDKRERKRLHSSFNPYAFQMEMEHLLERAGVEILYDTRVCQVQKRGEKLSHLIVENKSGRMAAKASVFIDATGDADLAFLAGCRTEEYPYNVLASWYYELKNEKLCLVTFSNLSDLEHRGGSPAVGPFYSGTEYRDVSRHVIDSRRLLRKKLAEKQVKNPKITIHPFALPSLPDLRITRRLVNRFSLRETDRHQWFDDTIGVTGDWRRKGPIYPIPLRSIHADACPNLFVIGRCMSSDHTVIDVTRAIGTCAVTGEAAGTAAALIVKDRLCDPKRLPISRLQQQLRAHGALISPELVKPHSRETASINKKTSHPGHGSRQEIRR
ncbi:MAG TPA: FAD-dependent oxidoreductase [Chthoniobacteraceae bacterium]|nr:FAD-dependent oxidoreductase [Chthoniobacteraceae bacterium]